MRYQEFHYRWESQLEASPEALWPFVADTNRFNRDAGVPAIEERSNTATTLDDARRRLRSSRVGVAIEWEEEPFEWNQALPLRRCSSLHEGASGRDARIGQTNAATGRRNSTRLPGLGKAKVVCEDQSIK